MPHTQQLQQLKILLDAVAGGQTATDRATSYTELKAVESYVSTLLADLTAALKADLSNDPAVEVDEKGSRKLAVSDDIAVALTVRVPKDLDLDLLKKQLQQSPEVKLLEVCDEQTSLIPNLSKVVYCIDVGRLPDTILESARKASTTAFEVKATPRLKRELQELFK